MTRIGLLPLALLALAGPALAQEAGDAAAGKTAFAPCSSCHDIGENAKNRMGPYLTGVVGRPAASVDKFTYSQAMVAARDAGLVWTPEAIEAFVTGPHDYVPGTKMPSITVRDEAARRNLVAYLLTFSPDFDPQTMVSTYAAPNADSAAGSAPSGSSSAAPVSAQSSSVQPSSAQ